MPGVPGKQPKKHQSAQVHALRLACIFDSKVSLQNSNPTTKTLHITKILPDFKHHKYGNQKTLLNQSVFNNPFTLIRQYIHLLRTILIETPITKTHPSIKQHSTQNLTNQEYGNLRKFNYFLQETGKSIGILINIE